MATGRDREELERVKDLPEDVELVRAFVAESVCNFSRKRVVKNSVPRRVRTGLRPVGVSLPGRRAWKYVDEWRMPGWGRAFWEIFRKLFCSGYNNNNVARSGKCVPRPCVVVVVVVVQVIITQTKVPMNGECGDTLLWRV